MVLPVNIINHANPQVSVTASDSGNPPITYSQIKNSLGSYVYCVDGFYMYSNNINQLIGAIQYNRLDVNGNQDFKTITTTVDPYQLEVAIVKDLGENDSYFILNGNSSFQTTILGNAFIKVIFYTRRVTSSFGMNLIAFDEMEKLFRKPDFFQDYGDIDKILTTNQKILESASNDKSLLVDENGKPIPTPSQKEVEQIGMMVTVATAVTLGYLLLTKTE